MKVITALQRGLQVLEILRDLEPATLEEITRESGLPKPTVLRILRTLAASRVAYQALSDRRWRTGAQMPTARPDNADALLAELAGPVLDRLCREILWPSDIGVFQDGAVQVLETSRRRSPFLVNRNVTTHRIHMLPSAMGRVILAWSEPARRAEILSIMAARGEGVDRVPPGPDFDDYLTEIRTRGYATRQRGYYVILPREGRISAIAVPVHLGGGRIAAVNLSWMTSAATEAEIAASALPLLRDAARQIEGALAEAQGNA
ncbi:helix-turn-helix domain-containing protein [Cereibacter sphaeroides]|nr:helix-turn-helix domain-containing protein [Cereibacter sphaeroides]